MKSTLFELPPLILTGVLQMPIKPELEELHEKLNEVKAAYSHKIDPPLEVKLGAKGFKIKPKQKGKK